jgi:hypothetical protein
MTTPRGHLTYANVASTLALAIALSAGGAVAADKVGPKQISNKAVKSRHIGPGEVRTSDVRGNAITGSLVRDGSLSGKDLANGSVDDEDLDARTMGVALAAVSVDSSAGAAITNAFNRLGDPISVNRTSTGTYEVTIPGANLEVGDVSNMIAALHGSFDDYCYITAVTSSTTAVIACRDFNNVSTDTLMTFILFEDAVN